MRKKVNLIIFDLDGTILDSKTDIINSVNSMLKAMGLKEKPFKEIEGFIGAGIQQLIVDSLESSDVMRVEEAVKIYKDIYRKHMFDNSILYPGTEKILKYFKDKKKAIMSNKSSEFIHMALKKFSIESFFVKVLGGDDENCRKPNPCPIFKLMKEFDASPQETVIVGDSLYDMKSGKDAGVLTCGVVYGIGYKEDVLASQPDFIIDNIVKLKDILM